MLGGVDRAGDDDRLAVQADVAGIRGEQPEQDLHQRALAGTVLPEQPVDLAGEHGEVHAVTCREGTEALVMPTISMAGIR